MLNDQEPSDRRHPLAEPPRKRHPLEERPSPPPGQPGEPPRPRITVQFSGVTPYIMWVVITINLLVFAAQFLMPELEREIYAFGVQRSYEVLLQGQYYRLLSSMFLHADIVHIFFNMYALYLFGRSIEGLFGHSRFAIIYLLGGLTGSILSIILGDPSPRFGVPSLGASGAVFAVFAAQMIFLYRNRELLGERAQQQLRSLVMLMFINLFLGIASNLSQSGIRIDVWGHVGGFIGGAILAWVIGPFFAVETRPDQPGIRFAVDSNPLAKNLWLVSVYGIALVAVLAYFSLRLRG